MAASPDGYCYYRNINLRLNIVRESENVVADGLLRMNVDGEVVDHEELHICAMQGNDGLRTFRKLSKL